jgi:ribosomal protein S27E
MINRQVLYTVECDRCHEYLLSEEGHVNAFADTEEAADAMNDDDWVKSPSGEIHCAKCAKIIKNAEG